MTNRMVMYMGCAETGRITPGRVMGMEALCVRLRKRTVVEKP